MSDVVTGEAVVLELRVAKLASRSLAFALDLALQLATLVVGALLLTGLATDAALAAALGLVLVVGTLLGYPVACETLSRGRTLGKLALGLRVVRDDGGPVRFRHALIRGLAAIVEIYGLSGTVALVVSLASRQGKRVGDYLAGTLVVRERVPAAEGAVVMMPPQLAGWAAALELSRLPDDLALAVRQYLARWHELGSDARHGMGVRLASAVAAHVSPAPPAGVPPEAYLSAVLAERRRRELIRLAPPDPAGSPAPPHAPPAPPHAPPAPSYAQPAPQRRDEDPFAPPG